MQIARLFFVPLLAAMTIAACGNENLSKTAACPTGNQTQARPLTGDGMFLWGPKAVGGNGDYLLRSRNAAYIISGPGPQKTYYHYPGILVDAAATRNCEQVTAEQFEELGLLFGKLNLADFSGSTLRAFRADTVEIVNDGRNGEAAHVRATGVDDYYWLVEYELIKRKFIDGGVRPLSEPFGVKVIVDYILAPGTDTLRIDLTIENQGDRGQKFMAGPEMIVGDQLAIVSYGSLPIEFGGFSLLGDIPFWSAGSAAGSYTFALKDGRLATTNISGVNANIDFEQTLTKPLDVPAGGADSMTMFFAAGPTDHHSATRMLQPLLAEPLPGWQHRLERFAGQVLDNESGAPVSGATVDVELPTKEPNDWRTLERYVTDADGRFGPDVAVFDVSEHTYRYVVRAPGRRPTEPEVFVPPLAEALSITLPPKGSIAYEIADGAGALIPAKISLYEEGKLASQWFVTGAGEIPVAPGAYEVSVTRGWEYTTFQGNVEVPENGTAKLNVQLEHVIDTAGYLSADTHVHSEPSPDSEVLLADRIRSAAGEGLEIPVATDHEIIHGIERGIAESGLESWVNTVRGEEFTASVPEHVTIFPVDPDGSIRGGPPVWYQHGLGELFSEAFGRGAKIGILNHPRGGCNYLCLIGWDPETATPTLQDPTQLGLPADSSLWTWNFHGLELMNGAKDPFLRPEEPERSGLFDDWHSFLNHGHRMIAVGASDEHGTSELGMPRIYFGTANELPELFHPQDLVDAMFSGNILVSTGAFARVTVDGKTMGDVVTMSDTGSGGNVVLAIRIEAIPEIDVTHFRVYKNCDEAVKLSTADADAVVKYDGTYALAVSKDATVVVAGFGKKKLPRGLPQFNPTNVPRFVSNAIYIDADGNGKFDPPGDKTCKYTRD